MDGRLRMPIRCCPSASRHSDVLDALLMCAVICLGMIYTCDGFSRTLPHPICTPRKALRSPCYQTRKVNESMASTPKSNGSLQGSAHNGQTVDSNLLTSLEWRSIGPYRGGRVVAVAGDPSHYHTFYFSSPRCGVWKTTDGR